MNREELIGKLQMVYVGDKNALNEMIDYYDELFDEMESWREEVKELKKLLEEKNKPQIFIDIQDMEERYSEGLYQDYLEEENKKYKNQQKEFINYLEDLIKQNETVVEVSKYGLPKNCSKLLIDFYKEILSKYKEIIGDDK